MNVEQTILEAGVLVSGHFIFANGGHGLEKLEMDNLWSHESALGLVLEALVIAEGLPNADVILGVPSGGQRLTGEMVRRGLIDLPMAYLERIPGGDKRDFRFVSLKDERLANSAQSVRIYEDVVTSGSSIAGVVKILNPKLQNIHTLAIWRRAKVWSEYAQEVTHHFLVEKEIAVFEPENCPWELRLGSGS